MDAYLFDLDGTLVESREDIAASANIALQAVGLPPRPPSEIFPFIGEGARRLIERALGPDRAGLTEQALAAWQAHYEQHMLDRSYVYAGIPEALAALPGPRAIVTNKPGPSARRLVAALGLGALCPVVLGGGDLPVRKPDPLLVRAALAQLPPVGRTVLVGDSAVDAQTARAAGIAFVGVLWGLRTRGEMEAEGARFFAGHPCELPRLCAQALAGGPLQAPGT